MVDDQDRREMRSDSPLDSPDQDKLGYSNFSNYLADAITTRVPTDGFTIGIYGQWGSGKSTILEFVEQSLNKRKERPIIVHFNPWWFSGQRDLFEMFFDELAVVLGEDSHIPEIQETIHRYSMTLSNLPVDMAGIPPSVMKAIGKLTEGDGTSIHELRDDISEALADSDRPIVVMIDDLDRLTPQEVSQMFQLVKSIADFPNMTYILAFDEDVVVNALEAEEGVENGREYLEKIVQLPVQIPVPEEGSLEDLIITQLLEIAGERRINERRFRNLIKEGVLPTISTPRHTTRLANAVNFSYAPVKDEVNFVDLVGIEFLKLFYKDIYEEIRIDRDRFTGIRRPMRQRTNDEDDYEDILPKEGEGREPAITTLKLLFPKVSSNLNSSYSMGTRKGEYRTKRRICHPGRYRVYFRLDLPQGMISWETMQGLLDATVDADEFTTQVLDLLNEDEVSPLVITEFVERVHERQDEIPTSDIPTVVRAFFSVGDRIVEVSDATSNTFHPIESKIVAFVLDLVERREEEELTDVQEDGNETVEILRSAIEKGDSPYLSTYLTIRLLRDHGEYDSDPLPEGDRVVALEEIDEIKRATAQVVQEYANRDQLLSVPKSGLVLKYWPEFTETDAPEQWAESKIGSRDEFIDFLGGFLMSSSLRSSASVGVTEQSYVDPRWLDPYLDLDEARERVEGYDLDDLDESRTTIVKIYRTAWDYLDSGDDPGSSETWHF